MMWRILYRAPNSAYTTPLLQCLLLYTLTFTLYMYSAHARRLKDGEELTMNTDKGRIRGVRYYLQGQGKMVEAYLGIPFAEPPIGHLRFRHPQPKEKWDDVKNTTRLPNSCYQTPDEVFGDFYGSSMWNSPTRVSEDCLYLNVWVPKVHPKLRKSAVLVWIYGGGFYSGTTTLSLYDGKLLAAEHNLIVVSIGYRVGALGFLTLDHHEAPGNAGLFDQLMALDWVQRNIRNFGGDPQNVTIFGESAGAVSVSMHLLSPLSRSKFQKAMIQSGSASTPWATYDMQEGKSRATDLGLLLGCRDPEHTDLFLHCLRNVPAQRLVDEQWVSRGIAQFPFVPIVDGVFLIEQPEMSLKRKSFKKCPILIGSNANEGSFFVIYEVLDDRIFNLERQHMNRADFLRNVQNLFYHYPKYRKDRALSTYGIDAIAFHYSNWLEPNDTHSNFIALDQAAGDAYFLCPVNALAHAYASAGENVYYYYFTQLYKSNPWPPWMGVLHGDEILFAFGEPLKPGLNFTESEKRLSRKMMTYWTNFAKTGDPNRAPASESLHEWPLHSANGKEYLELNEKYLDVADKTAAHGRGPRARHCAFWTEYLPQLLHATATQQTHRHFLHQSNVSLTSYFCVSARNLSSPKPYDL